MCDRCSARLPRTHRCLVSRVLLASSLQCLTSTRDHRLWVMSPFQTTVWTLLMTDLGVTSVSQTGLGKSGSAKPQALPVRNRKLNLRVFPWCHLTARSRNMIMFRQQINAFIRRMQGRAFGRRKKKRGACAFICDLKKHVYWYHIRFWTKQAQICFKKCLPNAHKLLFQWLDVLKQIRHFTIGHGWTTKESLSGCSPSLSAAFVRFCLTSHYFPSLHQQRH